MSNTKWIVVSILRLTSTGGKNGPFDSIDVAEQWAKKHRPDDLWIIKFIGVRD